jgi:hypothetical protein
MSKVANTFVGFSAVVAVFAVFVAYEVVKAGNRAVGVGVFPYVLTRPSFLLLAAVICVVTAYKVVHQSGLG